MHTEPRLENLSTTGYRGAGWLWGVSLVATHLFLLRAIRTTYRIRDSLPWLCIAVVSCFLSSSMYHACYSLDLCVFQDALMHRHCDYITSVMLGNVVVLSRLWVRSVVKNGQVQHSQTLVMTSTVKSTGHLNYQQSSDRLEQPFYISGDVMFVYPLWRKIYILFLYVVGLYAHVRAGRNEYFTKATIILTGVFTLCYLIRVAVVYGLRVRVYPATAELLCIGGAYAMYCMEESMLGAMGHSLWHVFDFLLVDIDIHYGPALAYGDGNYVSFV
jgi:hypothetical protein